MKGSSKLQLEAASFQVHHLLLELARVMTFVVARFDSSAGLASAFYAPRQKVSEVSCPFLV